VTAEIMIAPLARNQQAREIKRIKIGQNSTEQTWQRPRDCHQNSADIIEMARPTPKPRTEQRIALRGLHELRPLTPDQCLFALGSKAIFVRIDRAKNV